jgi:glycosyltransferase involved in cell wall biosynthesis
MTLKVLHVTHSDTVGGAAKAAMRLHACLGEAGVESRVWVDVKHSDDWRVSVPGGGLRALWSRLRRVLVKKFVTYVFPADGWPRSVAFFHTGLARRINASDADVVHFHWINKEMISIGEIGRIKKPIAWTFHDMWPVAGAEHYTAERWWQHGEGETGAKQGGSDRFGVSRRVWRRKYKSWQRPMHVIAPSQWLGECVRRSELMQSWPVTVIPNAIDTDCWKPVDRKVARRLLGLPEEGPVVLFGAWGGGREPVKGYDLLVEALRGLEATRMPEVNIIVFGQTEPRKAPGLPFPVHYIGMLRDDVSLRLVYCAADCLVVPSRMDNLPNTAVEAQACGTPVVAFDTGGLSDIVAHKKTGYLASRFSTKDLADGIVWVIGPDVQETLRVNSRASAVEKFSYAVVAKQHELLYQRIMKGSGA